MIAGVVGGIAGARMGQSLAPNAQQGSPNASALSSLVQMLSRVQQQGPPRIMGATGTVMEGRTEGMTARQMTAALHGASPAGSITGESAATPALSDLAATAQQAAEALRSLARSKGDGTTPSMAGQAAPPIQTGQPPEEPPRQASPAELAHRGNVMRAGEQRALRDPVAYSNLIQSPPRPQLAANLGNKLLRAEMAGPQSAGGYSTLIPPPPAPGTLPAGPAKPPEIDIKSMVGQDAAQYGAAAQTSRLAQGGVAATAGGEMAAFAGSLLKGATSVIGLTVAAIAAVKGIKAMGEAAVEAQRQYAPFHGGLATQMAKSDIQQINQQRQYAQATGGSAALMTQSQRGLREQWEPLSEDLGTITNLLTTGLIEVGTVTATIAKTAMGVARPLLKWLEKEAAKEAGGAGIPMQDFLRAVRDNGFTTGGGGAFGNRANMPKHPPMGLHAAAPVAAHANIAPGRVGGARDRGIQNSAIPKSSFAGGDDAFGGDVTL